MATLSWNNTLALDHPQMDRTHAEFVDLLGAAAAALPGPEPTLLQAFDVLVAHTVEHFAQEERWMAATGFGPENCHAFQHRAVLQVMRECARRAGDEADFEALRLAVDELAVWFPQHAQSMDAALAQHLAQVGFDPQTGQCAAPLPAADALTGCGSGGCR